MRDENTRYSWNGEKWVDLETGVYNDEDLIKKDDIANEIGENADRVISQKIFTDTLYTESNLGEYVEQTITTSLGYWSSADPVNNGVQGKLNSTNNSYKNVKIEIPIKTLIRVSGSVIDKGTALIIYLDANNNYVGEECRGTASMLTYTDYQCNIPVNAKYICITVHASSNISVKFASVDGLGYRFSLKTDLNQLDEKVTKLENYEVSNDYWANNVNLIGFIGVDGQITDATDKNWQHSDFINFDANISLDIRCYGHAAVNSVSFYDENKIYISGVAGDKIGTFEKVVNSPVGTRFIRLCGGSDSYDLAQSSKPFRALSSVSILTELRSLQTQINDISPESLLSVNRKQVKLNVTAGKVILYGDSISSTDYKWYKDAMEALTGATVYNGGFSGHSTASLAGNARLQRIFDYKPNLIVALVGGNDTGQVVGTFGAIAGEPIVTETDINTDYNGTYFIQAISHIIRKIKANYYNIRERANLTGSETPAEMEAKIDAVLKPYFAFCTTLPQKRNNNNDAFSNPANWARKRNAVLECCIKYDVHCIDLFNLVGWDMNLEPFWISPTNMTNNRGIYTMDGLHPNKYGYQQMASIVCGELGVI